MTSTAPVRSKPRAKAASRDAAAVRPRYRLFEVTGLELEYAVVDADLRPQCLVEDAFRALAGRPTSDVDLDHVGFSNELAAHVFEIKNLVPVADLADAERHLVDGVHRFSALLRERFEARLLPTAMHPFMNPSETRLWQRSGRAIYETYARLFPIQEHGWLNVQSCQINLPFGETEAETVQLHNAVCCLLPYLPALAASSPYHDGRLGPSVCNRMAFYKTNQKRIPELTGRVVPEYMTSVAQYRRDVFERIYAALDRIPGTARIRREFVNSRGAILRFDRDALEVRVVDLQECVRMDVAVATFVRLAARALVGALADGRLSLPDHAILVEDYDACVTHGRAARVFAPHLALPGRAAGGTITAEAVLACLIGLASRDATTSELAYLRLVEARTRTGNVSERIRDEVERRATPAAQHDALVGVYRELADCLDRNEPWRLA
jgi:carboxylate-amine ligase